MLKTVGNLILEGLYFDTVKLVTVRHLKLSLLHRAVQFGILCYIVVFAIYWERGYQATSPIYGTVFTKVKGVTRVGNITYDSSDLVVPPTENGAIFITTRKFTYRQHRGQCFDDSDPDANRCNVSSQCIEGSTTVNGYVLPECSGPNGYCKIIGWCDVEREPGVKDSVEIDFPLNLTLWTVFFRSSMVYTKFGLFYSNANSSAKEGYNIFTLKHITEGQDIPKLLNTGAIMHAQIDWTCDLDREVPVPKAKFSRIDPINTKSTGFNYRAVNYEVNETMDVNGEIIFTKRFLTKYYGIRIIVDVTGIGSRFDVFTLVITVGSSVAFFAVATFMTDFFLLYVHPYRNQIKRDKFKQLELRDSNEDYERVRDSAADSSAHAVNIESGDSERMHLNGRV